MGKDIHQLHDWVMCQRTSQQQRSGVNQADDEEHENLEKKRVLTQKQVELGAQTEPYR